MGIRTANRNLGGVVAVNAAAPYIDSRELAGRPNANRTYGTGLVQGRLVTLRAPNNIFGTKVQAAPIIWWSGREVIENGVRAKTNKLDTVQPGDLVNADSDGLNPTVFTVPVTPLSTVRFSSDTRLPGQQISVSLLGGEYFGRPRAQAAVTPYTGAYISWRIKTPADHQQRSSFRYVSKTGTLQPGEGYKVVDYLGVEHAAPGGTLYPTYRDPGGFANVSYWPSGLPAGPMKVVGLSSGHEIVFATATHWPYGQIIGTTPSVGEQFTFTDNDGVVHDSTETITAIDPVNKTVQISALPPTILQSKISGYSCRITGKTSGGVFAFDAFLDNANASKLFRYSPTLADAPNTHSSIATNGRFWINRKGSTYPEKRYFELGYWPGGGGDDSGYGFPTWSTGDWELVEIVHQLQDNGSGFGYAYGAINTTGRKYSNFVDLPGVDFTRAPELYAFGSDGTGGGTTIGDEVKVNELYYDVTCQRIYLSNAATYKSAGKNIELQLPVRWAPNEVSFYLNLGALNTAQPLYLYVADEKNYINGQDVNSYNNAADVAGVPVNLI